LWHTGGYLFLCRLGDLGRYPKFSFLKVEFGVRLNLAY